MKSTRKSRMPGTLGTSRILGLAVLASITSTFATAQDTGGYIGASGGQSKAKIDDVRIISGLLGSRITTTSITDDDRDTGYKIFGGYQFNRNFAIEGGYFDLGKFSFTANTLPLGTFSGKIKVKGLNLDLVGILPFTERFSAFGRVGVNRAEARDTFAGTGMVAVLNPNPSKRDTNYKAGVGLQYAFNPALAMRVEAERFRINDAVGNKGDIDLVSIGLVYRFGGTTPPYERRVTAVEPVREVIVPAPPIPVSAVVPAAPSSPPPPPPQPQVPRFERYTLSATELFAFDSAVLRLPHPKLDEIASALNANREISNVVITGYADRIGSKSYNQKLSERRAASVRNYLIGKGIDGSRLRAEGKSEANPVVVCTDKNRPALIKCLEPNRRVEVEQITIERRL